jgi:DNA-3-methyladenine glycosylase
LSNPVVPSFLKHAHKLKREFYTRPLITVAKELLGKILVKKEDTLISAKTQTSNAFLAGRIVEVEAYDGSVDQAAHTFIGKTKRNEIMFQEGGYLYVYFTYGVHFCSNVVTGKAGQGTAVLIRALEPVSGIEEMIKNRFRRDLKNEKEKLNLTNGPGKICQAFKINRDHYGADLTGNEIFIIDQPAVNNKDIIVTKRIGISKSVDLPWRFYIKDNPWVSRK